MTPCSEFTNSIPWYPPVGIFIGILGGIGVIVPWFIGDEKLKHKTVWSFVFIILVLLELRSIKLDGKKRDRDQAYTQCLQLDGFKQIGIGIQDSIRRNNEHFDVTIEKLNQNISTATKTFEQTRPYADVEFDRYIQDPQNPMTIQPMRPINVAFYFRNIGNDTAINIWKLGRIYVSSIDEKAAEKQIVPKFQEEWKEIKSKQMPGKVLAVGDPPRSENVHFAGFTPEQSYELQSYLSKIRIYFLFQIIYTDKTGTFVSDHCDVITGFDLVAGMASQRHCSFFNDPRHRLMHR